MPRLAEACRHLHHHEGQCQYISKWLCCKTCRDTGLGNSQQPERTQLQLLHMHSLGICKKAPVPAALTFVIGASQSKVNQRGWAAWLEKVHHDVVGLHIAVGAHHGVQVGQHLQGQRGLSAACRKFVATCTDWPAAYWPAAYWKDNGFDAAVARPSTLRSA